MSEPDDGVIDLSTYQRRKTEEASRNRTTFAFQGGEGERSRFALPLWRAAYLVGGRRSALLREPPGAEGEAGGGHAFVVLDLAVDPPRTSYPDECLRGLAGVDAPGTVVAGGTHVLVYLGERDDRRWYLIVDDLDDRVDEVEGRVRDDMLFLSGECAGLLFHRGLDVAEQADEEEDGEP